MRFEGFFASFSPSLDPVAHRSLAYSQSHGYIFLLPAFLFQFPRAFSSFFSPIGFLWCSHTSYRITLDFLLPMSVEDPHSLSDVVGRPKKALPVVWYNQYFKKCGTSKQR